MCLGSMHERVHQYFNHMLKSVVSVTVSEIKCRIEQELLSRIKKILATTLSSFDVLTQVVPGEETVIVQR